MYGNNVIVALMSMRVMQVAVGIVLITLLCSACVYLPLTPDTVNSLEDLTDPGEGYLIFISSPLLISETIVNTQQTRRTDGTSKLKRKTQIINQKINSTVPGIVTDIQQSAIGTIVTVDFGDTKFIDGVVVQNRFKFFLHEQSQGQYFHLIVPPDFKARDSSSAIRRCRNMRDIIEDDTIENKSYSVILLCDSDRFLRTPHLNFRQEIYAVQRRYNARPPGKTF